MTTKKIYMFFASDPFKTVEYFEEIKEACEHAKWNLYRYKMYLHTPKIAENMEVYVELDCHNENDIGNVGNHLRGISLYLLKHYPFMQKLKVGKRLLYFYEKEKNDE